MAQERVHELMSIAEQDEAYGGEETSFVLTLIFGNGDEHYAVDALEIEETTGDRIGTRFAEDEDGDEAEATIVRASGEINYLLTDRRILKVKTREQRYEDHLEKVRYQIQSEVDAIRIAKELRDQNDKGYE